MSNDTKTAHDTSAPLHGLLAEFDNVDALMDACTKVRDGGYKKWDAHTPFPVHGLDGAMGIKPTKFPWIVLAMGITGLISGLALQWYTNAFDYPFRISGKPTFSLPANIPVIFELTVLFTALTCFFGCLGLNKLPELFNPIFKSERFRRVTDDRFFVYVERKDPAFNETALTSLFKLSHALAVEPVHHDMHGRDWQLPKGMFGMGLCAMALTLIPLVLVARARESLSSLPRIHANPPAPVVDDMDSQYKHKPQSANWFFNDGRAMRQPPAGVVAEEDVAVEDSFHHGKDGNDFIKGFPAGVVVSEHTMARGQERFGIYCTPCHGISGHGDGMVARHADALQEGTWIAPTNLHEARVRELADGDIFNTITHGVRNMPGYGHSIDAADRWAIIMYVRALQLSQNAPKSAVPAETLPTLQ